jgi:hypothetical protein
MCADRREVCVAAEEKLRLRQNGYGVGPGRLVRAGDLDIREILRDNAPGRRGFFNLADEGQSFFSERRFKSNPPRAHRSERRSFHPAGTRFFDSSRAARCGGPI